MKASPALPGEIIINPEQKAVIVTSEVNASFPDVTQAFLDVDGKFLANNREQLKRMEESVFSFVPSRHPKSEVTCSLIHGQNVKDELLVVYAPFSDGAPNSSADEIREYMLDMGRISKNKAAPNSWSQVTKSNVFSELLQAIDHDMPVLTIFSPVPQNAYSLSDRQDFKRGDFSPAAYITSEAINEAQNRFHGKHSETRFSKLHLQGGSLGASNAVGAGRGLLFNYDVRSVTAQELIIGPRNIPDLAAKFTVKSTVGEESKIVVPSDCARIAEPLMRRMIDRDGYETATYLRMANAMSKLAYLKGLTKPDGNLTTNNIELLLGAGVPLIVALAENSGLTQDTEKYLPGGDEDVIHVRAESGHKANHFIDEHVALTAMITLLNIRRSAPIETF